MSRWEGFILKNLKHYIKSIENRARNLLFSALVSLVNSIFNNRLHFAPKEQITTLKYSGIFNNYEGLNIERVYKEWGKSEKDWNKGEYFKSIELKRNCLEYIYSRQRVDELRQIPPFMSIGWSAAIGHI